MSELSQPPAAEPDDDVMQKLGWLFDKIVTRQQRQGITDPREIAAALIALYHIAVTDHDELAELKARFIKLERFINETDGRG